MCATVYVWRHLVKATVTASLAESNGSLPPGEWLSHLPAEQVWENFFRAGAGLHDDCRHIFPVEAFRKYQSQWRNNRACKARSARGPSAVGGQNLPDAVFLKLCWLSI